MSPQNILWLHEVLLMSINKSHNKSNMSLLGLDLSRVSEYVWPGFKVRITS